MSPAKSTPDPSERLAGTPALPSGEVGRLYAEVAPGLLRFLRSLLGSEADAADCLQECFAVLVARGGECLPSARKAWLYSVARNQAAALVRRRATGRRVTEQHGIAQTQQEPSTEGWDVADLAIRAERQQQVRVAVENLPPEQRQVVELRIYEDLTFKEIARRLNIPLGTALSRMHKALQRLAHGLQDPT